MATSGLDPQIAAFVDQMTQAWAAYPPIGSLPLVQARAVAEEVRQPWRQGGPVMRRIQEYHVPDTAGPLRIRVYDPGIERPGPALIYLHGGGFTLFSIDTHDRLMREYAAAGSLLVIGVDYALSPEARYPVALDQTIALIDWLAAEGGSLIGVDPTHIMLGGDSAGANLSLAAALRLRDRGGRHQVAGLLLNYGAFGVPCSDEAEARFGGPGSVLDRSEMEYYFANYLGGAHDLIADPYARPAFADLHDLPPSLFVVAECDILAEQNYTVAQRMTEAGGDVRITTYEGATHSFLEAMSVASVAQRAIADGADWLRMTAAA